MRAAHARRRANRAGLNFACGHGSSAGNSERFRQCNVRRQVGGKVVEVVNGHHGQSDTRIHFPERGHLVAGPVVGGADGDSLSNHQCIVYPLQPARFAVGQAGQRVEVRYLP